MEIKLISTSKEMRSALLSLAAGCRCWAVVVSETKLDEYEGKLVGI